MSKRTEKQYPLEFKQSSVQLALNSEESIAQIARNLGVNGNTLHGWIRKYGKKIKNKPITEMSHEEEIKQLKKEISRLREERDILKKAAAYFANEMS